MKWKPRVLHNQTEPEEHNNNTIYDTKEKSTQKKDRKTEPKKRNSFFSFFSLEGQVAILPLFLDTNVLKLWSDGLKMSRRAKKKVDYSNFLSLWFLFAHQVKRKLIILVFLELRMRTTSQNMFLHQENLQKKERSPTVIIIDSSDEDNDIFVESQFADDKLEKPKKKLKRQDKTPRQRRGVSEIHHCP